MSIKKTKGSLIQQSRNIILIFVSLASLMIVSALFELSQSKKELFQLMSEQSHALLESVMIASQNSLLTNEYLEELSKRRLLNNANLIKSLYERGRISNEFLANICQENDIYRINIFNQLGEKIYSSHKREHFDLPEKTSPQTTLYPILTGEVDTLIIGIKPARFEEGFRYAVALSTDDFGAIVLNIDAQQILDFKRHIGFGTLLRNMVSGNPRIIYAALQDTLHILAASGNVRVLEAIQTSDFLTQSLRDSLFLTRMVEFDSLQVFEAVHPFSFRSKSVGLFRVGLSIDPIEDINQRIFRRLIIITIVLVVIGFFLLTYLFIRQRYSILQKQYEVVETYSGNIISHVSDAIIVSDQINGIKIFNTAAEKLFDQSKTKTLGSSLEALFNQSDSDRIFKDQSRLQQIDCLINGKKKYLLISKSPFSDSENNENKIIVIRDLTERKHLQDQMDREKRLTAMGELASGVAHEIRNPLNTIGTIIQQLDKDFEPPTDKEEYHQLARLVLGEVKRINETTQDFLRFARPEPIQPTKFQIQSLFQDLKNQYDFILDEKKIKLDIRLNWRGEVAWDQRQIRQVFINLIQNAIEAVENNGNILLQIDAVSKDELKILFKDDGPGMEEKIRSNIFNLYFTTKAKGTGIGLSIVQRIIYEHGGIITVESEPGQGTIFYITFPIIYSKS